MTKKLHGKVHGKTIELDEDPGVPDGQQVELQMQIEPTERKWGEASSARQAVGLTIQSWTRL